MGILGYDTMFPQNLRILDIFGFCIESVIVIGFFFLIISKIFKFENNNYKTALKASVFTFSVSLVLTWIWNLYTINYKLSLYLFLSAWKLIFYFVPAFLLYVVWTISFIFIMRRFYNITEWYKQLILFVLYVALYVFLFMAFGGGIPF